LCEVGRGKGGALGLDADMQGFVRVMARIDSIQ
jgi:hypothetical protein